MADEYDPDALREEYEKTLRAQYGDYDPVAERKAEIEAQAKAAQEGVAKMAAAFRSVGKAIREAATPAIKQMSETIEKNMQDIRIPKPVDPLLPPPSTAYGRAEFNMPTMSPLEAAAQSYMEGLRERIGHVGPLNLSGSIFINGSDFGPTTVEFDEVREEGGDYGPKHEGGDAESGDRD